MSETKKASSNSTNRLGRYEVVRMARDWIIAMKDTEEYRNFGQSEIVKQAIEEVKSGRATAVDIEKALAARKKTAGSTSEAGAKNPEKEITKGEK